MATENILMAAVAAGGDRQDLHERIRQHSQAAAAVVKAARRRERPHRALESDKAFAGVDLDAAIDPAKLTGRSAEQVDEFLAESSRRFKAYPTRRVPTGVTAAKCASIFSMRSDCHD